MVIKKRDRSAAAKKGWETRKLRKELARREKELEIERAKNRHLQEYIERLVSVQVTEETGAILRDLQENDPELLREALANRIRAAKETGGSKRVVEEVQLIHLEMLSYDIDEYDDVGEIWDIYKEG